MQSGNSNPSTSSFATQDPKMAMHSKDATRDAGASNRETGEGFVDQVTGAVGRITSQVENVSNAFSQSAKHVQQVADVAKETPITLMTIAGLVGFAVGVAWASR